MSSIPALENYKTFNVLYRIYVKQNANSQAIILTDFENVVLKNFHLNKVLHLFKKLLSKFCLYSKYFCLMCKNHIKY